MMRKIFLSVLGTPRLGMLERSFCLLSSHRSLDPHSLPKHPSPSVSKSLGESLLQNCHYHNTTLKIIYSLTSLTQLSTHPFPLPNIFMRSFEFMIYNHQQPCISLNIPIISLFSMRFFGEEIIYFLKVCVLQGLDGSQCPLPYSLLLQNCSKLFLLSSLKANATRLDHLLFAMITFTFQSYSYSCSLTDGFSS